MSRLSKMLDAHNVDTPVVLGIVAVTLIALVGVLEITTGQDFHRVAEVRNHRYTPEYYTDRYCTDSDTETVGTDSKGKPITSTSTHTYVCGQDYHPPAFGLDGVVLFSKIPERVNFGVNEGEYRSIADGDHVRIVIHVGGVFGSRTAELDR